MGRDYRKEYLRYGSRPEQKKRRAARNRVRRRALASGRVKKGDGKEIDHKDHNPHNDNPKNLRVISASKNRGWARDSNNKPIKKTAMSSHIDDLIELAKPRPKILNRLVFQLKRKGMNTGQAHAIATKQLQKSGNLKKGTQKATAKGARRGRMTPRQRAISRGRSPNSIPKHEL